MFSPFFLPVGFVRRGERKVRHYPPIADLKAVVNLSWDFFVFLKSHLAMVGDKLEASSHL
jgi:hypothetical protein